METYTSEYMEMMVDDTCKIIEKDYIETLSTSLLSQHMLIRHIFIIISFTIQPHLTAIINSEIFCFAALHFKG